ncbi:MAG: sulfotransferase domain-containing protein [Alphaproteobacteria bacterium]|nr:sulfotransferase domain-containing protein [Alphaproteobacteria bacterium]
MQKIDIFHIGPQKSATTWLYHCFREHPDIVTARSDNVCFFDMFFSKGKKEGLNNHFPDAQNEQLLIDMTQSYIRSPLAAKRIYDYNPSAKIILCLREPIARAFSHYWHNKKKADFDVPFEQMFKNYDLYASWVETGFYARHIERFMEYFPKEKVYVQHFSELQDNPEDFLEKTLEFMGVDPHFKPSALDKKVNAAKARKSKAQQARYRLFQKFRLIGAYHAITKVLQNLRVIPQDYIETLDDVSPETKERLLEIFEPETQRLEKLLDIDLSEWRKRYR